MSGTRWWPRNVGTPILLSPTMKKVGDTPLSTPIYAHAERWLSVPEWRRHRRRSEHQWCQTTTLPDEWLGHDLVSGDFRLDWRLLSIRSWIAAITRFQVDPARVKCAKNKIYQGYEPQLEGRLQKRKYYIRTRWLQNEKIGIRQLTSGRCPNTIPST